MRTVAWTLGTPHMGVGVCPCVLELKPCHALALRWIRENTTLSHIPFTRFFFLVLGSQKSVWVRQEWGKSLRVSTALGLLQQAHRSTLIFPIWFPDFSSVWPFSTLELELQAYLVCNSQEFDTWRWQDSMQRVCVRSLSAYRNKFNCKWAQEIMLIRGLAFQVTTELLRVTNEVFDTPKLVKFSKNIIITNIQSFFSSLS